jgi:outer membrane protein
MDKILMEYALRNRMELQIASDESLIDYEHNGTLPLFSVNYTYNINGLGPEADDAYDLLLRNRFADQRVGLVIQIPIGNETAKTGLII